jgi:DNA-binding MarR family transcriptional regulator
MTTILIGYLLSVRHLGAATARDVARHRNGSKAAAHVNLSALVRLGMLDATTGSRNARIYSLTEEGEIAAAKALQA